MDHPLGTAFPISGLVVDSSLKILPLVGNVGTWQLFEIGATSSIASGTVTVATNGRAVGTNGQSYNPDLAVNAKYPYTGAGVTYVAVPSVGKWYEVVIFGKAVLGLADVACRASLFRLVAAEDTPGVPKVTASNLPTFPANFAKLLIGTNGKVTPVDVTVCGYANGMAPATMAEVMQEVKEARTLPLSFRNDGGQPVVDLTIATSTWGVTVNVPVFMDTADTVSTNAAKEG